MNEVNIENIPDSKLTKKQGQLKLKEAYLQGYREGYEAGKGEAAQAHGHWIEVRLDSPTSLLNNCVKRVLCSKCNSRTSFKTKCCAECGAKMDGEIEIRMEPPRRVDRRPKYE